MSLITGRVIDRPVCEVSNGGDNWMSTYTTKKLNNYGIKLTTNQDEHSPSIPPSPT
jgi:hypothetical protein